LDPHKIPDRIFLWFERKIDNMGDKIIRILAWAFRKPALTFLITTLLFVFAVALISLGFIGDEFANIGDRGEFIIEMELPKSVTLEENSRVAREIEKYLMQKPEITNVFTTVGLTSNLLSGQSTSNLTEMNVQLVGKEYRENSTNIYARLIKNELESTFPGVKITSVPSSFLGTADDAPIMLDISAPTVTEALEFGNKLKAVVDSIPGTIEEKLSIQGGIPELSIKVDREKMKLMGFSLMEVGANLQAAFSGNTDSNFRDGNYEYPINIRLDDFDRNSREDVESLTMLNQNGTVINLGQFAKIQESTSPSRLERKNRIASVSLQAQAIGRPTGNIGTDIKTALVSMDIPENISISFEGDLKYQEDAFGSLGLAFLISLLFVYLIMVALYDSFLHPFVVLFSIPLAIIGALIVLALVNQSLSIFSLLGIIMLIGLVTKNTILVIDFTNELRRNGYSIAHALVTASKLRLRPILMTALSMIIALFPIALASGAGAEWKNSLAWVLIGGLTSSLFLSLIFVPVVYLVAENTLTRVQNGIRKLQWMISPKHAFQE
jgi:multidrug efflux pump subunit AcrB